MIKLLTFNITLGGLKMSKEIPQFSARNMNKIDDYERFYNTKAYLKKKSGELTFFKDETDKIMKLAKKSGYTKFNKFVEHRKEWHKMKRKIPLKYLMAIGVKLNVLDFTIELDKKEYEAVLKLPRFPEFATIRMHPAYYKNKKLPENISEKEAIEIMREYALKEEKRCFINYPNIKMIGFRPDGSYYEIFYEPDIEIDEEYIYPTQGGEKVGKIIM